MGILFTEHPEDDSKHFVCRSCECPLASASSSNVSVEQSISAAVGSNFRSNFRSVYIFKKAVNLNSSGKSYHQKDPVFRGSTVGKKMVRDVYCKKCDLNLGWLNEFIEDSEQQYKEGQISLHGSAIAVRSGIDSQPKSVLERFRTASARRDFFGSALERIHDEFLNRRDDISSDSTETESDSEREDYFENRPLLQAMNQRLQFINEGRQNTN